MEKNKLKIDLNFFKQPINKFLNKFKIRLFTFNRIELFSDEPCIYLSPYVSNLDEKFITECISSKFVFLNKDITTKISNGSITKEDEKILLEKIEELKQNKISLSIIYGETESVFGENKNITAQLGLFLRKTKLDIKILTFPNEYFANPVWSDEIRQTKIYSNQQINILNRMLVGLREKEVENEFIRNSPSSASIYLKKFQLNLKSNNLASGLERVIYCCPHCKSLLSLYSEFCCIKCNNCRSAFELTNNGYILFAKEINKFDDIENFQFSVLSKKDFDVNIIKQYDKITQYYNVNCKNKLKNNVILQIYADKIAIQNIVSQSNEEYLFEDIKKIDYLKHNTIFIQTKNAKQFYLSGKTNENLFILKDLLRLNNN